MSATENPLLVGVDFGTTRIRALVVTTDGRVVASGDAPTPIEQPKPGWAQHDPEALWQATVTALRQAVGKVDAPDRIAGLAVASVGEAGVPLDSAGEPTYPAIAWFDTRPEAECRELTETIGEERIARATGCGPNPMFGLSKLLWLKAHAPEAFGRTVRWLNMADYLAWRLSGVAATDYSLASRTLALDLAAGCWNEALIAETGLPPSLFAPLTANGAPLGPITREAAAATGLPRHCVVGVGGHDHIVGALAAGAWQPGTLLNSLGTAEALLLAHDRPQIDLTLAASGYAQGAMMLGEPLYYVVAANFTAGASVEWLMRLLGPGQSHGTLIDEAAAVPAGCNGVHFLPTLRVGNPPHPDSVARGAMVGLYPEATRDVLYRAVLEGLAYESRQMLDGMQQGDQAGGIERIRAIGGLSRNRLLMTIKASLFDKTITVLDMAEATALGAAILGGMAAGVFADVDTALAGLTGSETEVAPDPALRDLYAERYETIYQQLRPATAGVHSALIAAEPL